MMTGNSDVRSLLDEVFEDFLSGNVPRRKTAKLGDLVRLDDFDTLMEKLESIGDVHDYVDDQETFVPGRSSSCS